jgi:hypothetical protein
MMGRCYNPRNKDYAAYGGRGILVCAEWHDPAAFVADLGPRDLGWSLERSDVNGDYCPSNCSWIPLRDQSKNRRRWTHSPAGIARLSVWSGKSLSQEHREKISLSVAKVRRAEKD